MTVTFGSGGCCGRSIWSRRSVCRNFKDCPPASKLASEYGPQWMNMPNLASRYQRARSLDKPEPNLRLRINGSDHPASASLMKSRREGEQALTRAEMLSRYLLVQNRSGSPSRSISFSSSAHERPGNDYFSDPDFRPGIVSA